MLSFVRELWRFMRVRKKYWLAPIFVVWLAPLFVMLALLGALLVATKGSVIAPFIYTLF